METYDLVVIGAGPGGYPAAIRAAQLGASVAIVEREDLGGTCLNWGCIPTKTLIASAELYAEAGQADALGVHIGQRTFDYAAMIQRKGEVVARLKNGVGGLLKAHGVTLLEGTASFESSRRITVTPATGDPLAAAFDKAVIATGSTSAMPGFIPQHDRILESRAFLDRTSLPSSLIVLGGGVIGCEFACMAAMLDCKVTVVEMLDDILMVLDPDVRKVLRKHMEKGLGITVLTGAAMNDIAATDRGIRGTVGDQAVSADMMLVAIGRVPVTEGLNPAAAGITLDERGCIPVDAYGRTDAGSIYAIGDVTAGSTQLAHAATSQGITAAEHALGQRTPRETLVPACIFTSPEIGSVGLTEIAAAEQGRDIKTGTYHFSGLGKAMAAHATTGFVKWIAEARTDQLLGAHAVGAHATELIAEATVAIRAELTAEELGRTIHCHPTFSETWMEAAHAVHGTCIHAPPARKRR